ncbi:MAG: type 1 glutamine amidotransferase [Candidatus Dormibacter sp.]
MKPVLCIRNDRDDSLGISAAVFAEAGLPVQRLDAFERGASWPDLAAIGGLMVFGGEMNVDESDRYPFLPTQRQLLRRAVEAGVPVLGVCLGAQLLARALDTTVYHSPVRELGFTPVTITKAGSQDPLVSCFKSGDRVFQWHEDTFELPKGATMLATGDEVTTQAFRFGSSAWGVQFHFEVDRAGVEAWLRVAEPGLERGWQRNADQIRGELDLYLEAQQARSRRLLSAFARHVSEAQLA